MIDKLLIPAIYGVLRTGRWSNEGILKELKIAGHEATEEDIDVLRAIVLSTKSRNEAVKLAKSVDDEKREQLLDVTKAKSELEEKAEAAAKKSADEEKKKLAARKEQEEQKEQKKKAEAQLVKVKLRDELKRNNIYEHISSYRVVHEKTAAGVQMEVNELIKQGYVPFGGIGAAAFGMSPVGGNSFVQAMVSFSYKE